MRLRPRPNHTVDKVHFLIGGRYDILSYGTVCCAATSQISDHEDNRLNPRFGIVYQPWQWLSVYGNYVESIGSNNGLTRPTPTTNPNWANNMKPA